MPTILCTLGTDPADAALNRPALILQPAEYVELARQADTGATPTLALFLGAGAAAPRRTLGASQLPVLRAEIRAALRAIGAAQLPRRLLLALSLQRLDSLCDTAQELGLNIYVTNDE